MLALLGETPSALSVELTMGDKEKAQAIDGCVYGDSVR